MIAGDVSRRCYTHGVTRACSDAGWPQVVETSPRVQAETSAGRALSAADRSGIGARRCPRAPDSSRTRNVRWQITIIGGVSVAAAAAVVPVAEWTLTERCGVRARVACARARRIRLDGRRNGKKEERKKKKKGEREYENNITRTRARCIR